MSFTEETEPPLVRKTGIFSSLLILVGFVLLGLFVGQIVALVGILPLFDYNFQGVLDALTDPMGSPKGKAALLIIQAASSIFGFILAPLLHQRLIDQRRPSPNFLSLDTLVPVNRPVTSHPLSPSPSGRYETRGIVLGMVFLLMIAFMLANSVVIEWNMNLDFSQLSPSFEEWARSKEDELRVMTEYLTRFDNLSGLLVGLIVIAVLPAIGEEFLFRGLVQPKLQKLLGNPHLAVWMAALLFSTIHMQFYGFFPRLLLGALFGYLFYWSGNLWYAIFAHFVNNGFTLVMMYLYQQDMTDLDMDATESVPWTIVVLALVGGIFLLFQFRRITMSRQSYEQ